MWLFVFGVVFTFFAGMHVGYAKREREDRRAKGAGLLGTGTHVMVSKVEWTQALKAMGIPRSKWQKDLK